MGRLLFLRKVKLKIEGMDNFHGLLVIADQAPVGDYLRSDRFGFDVIDDMANVLLKGLRFEMCFAKRAEGIHTEHDRASVLTVHEGERIELTVKWTDRIDGATTRLWFKKRTDVEIVVRFQLDLSTFPVRLWTEQHRVGTVCDGFLRLKFGEDGGERTIYL